MIPTILLVVMFLAVTGLVARERLWGGMLRFLNVLVAATMATAWYEPLATLGDRFVNVADGGENQGGLMPPFGQFLDAAAAWALFLVILLVLRIVTWLMSRTRVPFPKLLDLGGGVLLGVLTAWVVVCFTAMTFHMTPLSREGVQPTPDARMFLGLAPDRKWLAWVRGGTGPDGPFSTAAEGEAPVFDRNADFVLRYGDRRAGNAKALGAESAQ
ncbi:MAG: CvpA family protein [Pirellulales bacterium]|nr:CvpA family protein [Pirellulales bacterium]